MTDFAVLFPEPLGSAYIRIRLIMLSVCGRYMA